MRAVGPCDAGDFSYSPGLPGYLLVGNSSICVTADVFGSATVPLSLLAAGRPSFLSPMLAADSTQQSAARPDTAASALAPKRHSGQPGSRIVGRASLGCMMSVTLNIRHFSRGRLGPPHSFHALHAAPSISSMNTDSFDARLYVSEGGPEGVWPSYSPLPLLMAPEPGTVVPSVTVLGPRTRSQTRRPTARKPRAPRTTSPSGDSPQPFIDPFPTLPTQPTTDAFTPASPLLCTLPPSLGSSTYQHDSRSPRGTVTRRDRIHRICRAIHAFRLGA